MGFRRISDERTPPPPNQGRGEVTQSDWGGPDAATLMRALRHTGPRTRTVGNRNALVALAEARLSERRFGERRSATRRSGAAARATAHVCLAVGLPEEVAHIALGHSMEGPFIGLSTECMIVR